MHCRTLHPIFRTVAEKYRENDKIIFARMDLGEFKPFDLKVSFLAEPADRPTSSRNYPFRVFVCVSFFLVFF